MTLACQLIPSSRDTRSSPRASTATMIFLRRSTNTHGKARSASIGTECLTSHALPSAFERRIAPGGPTAIMPSPDGATMRPRRSGGVLGSGYGTDSVFQLAPASAERITAPSLPVAMRASPRAVLATSRNDTSRRLRAAFQCAPESFETRIMPPVPNAMRRPRAVSSMRPRTSPTISSDALVHCAPPSVERAKVPPWPTATSELLFASNRIALRKFLFPSIEISLPSHVRPPSGERNTSPLCPVITIAPRSGSKAQSVKNALVLDCMRSQLFASSSEVRKRPSALVASSSLPKRWNPVIGVTGSGIEIAVICQLTPASFENPTRPSSPPIRIACEIGSTNNAWKRDLELRFDDAPGLAVVDGAQNATVRAGRNPDATARLIYDGAQIRVDRGILRRLPASCLRPSSAGWRLALPRRRARCRQHWPKHA